MTPKSMITLCVVAIVYVLIAALAIVTPHGSSYALTGSDGTESTSGSVQTEDYITLKTDSGIEIQLFRSKLATFSASEVTVEIDGEAKSYSAASLKSILLWSGLESDVELIVALDSKGKGVTYRSVDLERDNNAYIIYSKADGSPLDEDFGKFCLYIVEGKHSGIMLDLAVIDFG